MISGAPSVTRTVSSNRTVPTPARLTCCSTARVMPGRRTVRSYGVSVGGSQPTPIPWPADSR